MDMKKHKIDSILLVDDESDIREVLTIALMDMGYNVFEAEDATTALQVFEKEKPPIVLTDIKMPGMDGIELLQRIKRENAETEVIMITGHGDMNLAIKSLKNDATDFITKPINVDALEIALGRAVDKIVVREKLKEYTQNLEQLVREKTELQDHLSSLGLMIGSISHGIKGLLTGLDGGMYLVDSGFKKEDRKQVADGWNVVKFTVERIRKMVLDILYYAKQRELQWEKVQALSLAREVARTVEPEIKSSQILFTRDFDPDTGAFEIDPGYIHSALINIMENAIDACVQDDAPKAHQIIFRVRENKDAIVFTIEDNGIGMSRETRDKIFSLFFSSKGRRGTGLGLFISSKIIGQHGGEIQVSSTPGRGSAFTVTIPVKQK